MNKKLPELDTEYKISQDQVQQFQRDGHILLRGVCSKEEIEAYRHHIGAAVREHAKTQDDLSERDTYGKAFLQVINIWTYNEAVKRFVFGRRFAQIAAQLSISPAVRLYHDQALYKEGLGGITPWHQDQFYWPLDTDQTLTMWMPLVDVSAEMGPMDFATGSQIDGYLGDRKISDDSEDYFKDYVKDRGFAIHQSGAMQAGDVTFHNGWTLHSAPPNRTEKMREVMTIIYYPDGSILTEPKNQGQHDDIEKFYPGMKPGEIAANELTPILYDGK